MEVKGRTFLAAMSSLLHVGGIVASSTAKRFLTFTDRLREVHIRTSDQYNPERTAVVVVSRALVGVLYDHSVKCRPSIL